MIVTWPQSAFSDTTFFEAPRHLYEITSSDSPVLRVSESESSTEFVTPVEIVQTISAESVFVTDETSGSILLEKSADIARPPASTTKLMTALVARDEYYLSQVLEVKEEAFTQGNTIGLIPGERISVAHLLEGLLIRSGNDAAFVLANNHPQGYQGFVNEMNQRASDLSMNSSSFSNPSGLDGFEQQMSARDLAILAREVVKDDHLRQTMATQSKVITDVSGELRHDLYSTHELLHLDPTVLGGKTGTTDGAGQVLVTRFNRFDDQGKPRTIQIVIMNSQDRYADTRLLIDWVLDAYFWQKA